MVSHLYIYIYIFFSLNNLLATNIKKKKHMAKNCTPIEI